MRQVNRENVIGKGSQFVCVSAVISFNFVFCDRVYYEVVYAIALLKILSLAQEKLTNYAV